MAPAIRRIVHSLLLAALLCAGAVSAGDDLTLRAHDAIAEPGGLAAIVLRTYAPRPIGVGQVCLRAGAGGTTVFSGVEGHQVFSAAGDVISSVELRADADGQELVIDFESPSGTANLTDGPLAVLYVRLSPEVQIGQSFVIDVDPGNTVLFEPDGDAIVVDGRSGDLEVRAPGAPFLLEAEGDSVVPGGLAELGVETFEPFAVGSGTIVLRWPRRIAAAAPTVLVDPRHGLAEVSIEASRRRVRVELTSPDGTFNSVPGAIVRVFLPLESDLEPGSDFTVRIGRQATSLLDPSGQSLPLELEKDRIEIE